MTTRPPGPVQPAPRNNQVAATVLEAIRTQRVVAIVRTREAAAAGDAAEALLGAGLKAVEVSLTTPNAVGVLADLAASLPAGAHVGAGTVMTVEEVHRVAEIGATFVVAPGLRPEVVRAAHTAGLAAIPGAATPTEMLAAVEAGADLVKLFPASAWLPDVLRDVLQALPRLSLVPTGGVSTDGAADWIRAGATAVGIGSALSRGTPQQVAARARTLLQQLAGAR